MLTPPVTEQSQPLYETRATRFTSPHVCVMMIARTYYSSHYWAAQLHLPAIMKTSLQLRMFLSKVPSFLLNKLSILLAMWLDSMSLHKHSSSYSKYADSWMGTWWRHQMKTFSALPVNSVGYSPVTGEFPSQKPVMRIFDLRLNKRLSKHTIRRWLETPPRSAWCHCYDLCRICIEMLLKDDVNALKPTWL